MSPRNILVAGGTGFIGSHIAEMLAARGDNVTILARNEPSQDDPPSIAGLPRLLGDYAAQTLTADDLAGFDSIAFAAGQDIRHIAGENEDEAFWDKVQRHGVPAFARLAKKAGVARFVQIGSYYHHLRPDLAEAIPYVAARRDADVLTRDLSDDVFAAMTLNPPSIIGVTPGRNLRRFAKMIAWVRGELPEPPLFAPTGGTNYMSVRSLAQATVGALDRGVGGTAYLIGDQNLRYQEYFQTLADAAGSTITIEERDENQPYQADRFIVQGRGNVLSYEPDAAETEMLGYDRNDVRRALDAIVRDADADSAARKAQR